MQKVPHTSTIRNNIRLYAEKVGMRIEKNVDGSYNVWSIEIGYITHRGVNMDTVVRVVVDELHMKNWREAGYPS